MHPTLSTPNFADYASLTAADLHADSPKGRFQADSGSLKSPAPVPPSGTPPSSQSPFRRQSRDVSRSPTGPMSPSPPTYPSPVRPSPRRALQFNASSLFAKPAESKRGSPSALGNPALATKPQTAGAARQVNELIQARKVSSFDRQASNKRSMQLGTTSHRLLGPVPGPPPPSLLQPAPRPQEPLGEPASSFRHRRYIVSKSPPLNARYLVPTPPPAEPVFPSLEPLSLSQVPSGPCTIRHRSTTPVRVTKDTQLARRQSARRQSPQRTASNSQALTSCSSTSGTISALPMSSRIASTSASLNGSSRLAPLDSTAAAPAARPREQAPSREGPSLLKAGESATAAVERAFGENSVSASNVTADGEGSFVDSLAGYSIGKVIGKGGFCQVKVGVHELSGRSVAIKVIDKVCLSLQS
jgi:hypothetical protein